MTLTIWYAGDDTPTTIYHIASIDMITGTTIRTRTYGNEPVTHRCVAGFTVTYNKG